MYYASFLWAVCLHWTFVNYIIAPVMMYFFSRLILCVISKTSQHLVFLKRNIFGGKDVWCCPQRQEPAWDAEVLKSNLISDLEVDFVNADKWWMVGYLYNIISNERLKVRSQQCRSFDIILPAARRSPLLDASLSLFCSLPYSRIQFETRSSEKTLKK